MKPADVTDYAKERLPCELIRRTARYLPRVISELNGGDNIGTNAKGEGPTFPVEERLAMEKMLRSVTAGLLVALLLSGGAFLAASYQALRGDSFRRTAQKPSTNAAAAKPASEPIADAPTPAQQPALPDRQDHVDAFAPSGGKYPLIKQGDDIWIDVPIRDQQVRIMNGSQPIYSMVTSSGMEPTHSTPRGTYYIEPERGTWFFSPKYQEGAQYWVSFKGHGVYLFHTVAMDSNQRIIDSEAGKLGQTASHGCLRLTVSDARWLYENIPAGTRVVIHE